MGERMYPLSIYAEFENMRRLLILSITYNKNVFDFILTIRPSGYQMKRFLIKFESHFFHSDVMILQ